MTKDSVESYWVNVDAKSAVVGNYIAEFIIDEVDRNGELVSFTIEI